MDYVINYDLPEIAETYVHRVGRTGRGVKRGRAVAFCCTEEKNLLDAIEKYMDKKVKVLELSQEQYELTMDLTDSKMFSIKDALLEIEQAEDELKKRRKK